MGTFKTGCIVSHIVDRDRSAVVPNRLVDTGSEYTWTLEGLNLTIDPRQKKLVPAGPLPVASGIHHD